MTDLFSLAGNTIVITGAGGILGSHFTRHVLDDGATVVALDSSPDALEQLVNELPTGVASRLDARVVDISDEAEVQRVVADIFDRHGAVHGLVNNAASKSSSLDGFFAAFDSSSLETWREVNAVNLDGSYLMAREVGRRMAEAGAGSIVQIASIYGVVGPDQRIYEGSEYLGRPISSPAVYSASKAGVIGLATFLSTWWGDRNVRVNCITPGGVSSGQNDVFEARYSARVPLGRMATADDMVGPLTFLLSDAARYVTGHNLVVDGGLTAW